MKNFLLALSLGAAIGGSLVFAFLSADSRSPDGTSLSISESTMTVEEADEHRNNDYVELNSLPAVLQLPTPFSRNAALYSLSSRASAGQLVGLVNEAARINDASTRRQFLGTLLARLVDVDPVLAVDVAYGLESADRERWIAQVWTVWSTADLDAALDRASRIGNRDDRYRAAIAMFRAHGFVETKSVLRISEALGIEPDATVKLEYVTFLAEHDLEGAVNYVRELPAGMTRQRGTMALAQSLSAFKSDQLSELLASTGNDDITRMLEMQMRAFGVQADPESAVLATLNGSGQDDGMFHMAAQSLAESNLPRAIELLELATSPRHRQVLSSSIAQIYANRDPEGALAWARSSNLPKHQRDELEATVIMAMAKDQPELAFSIAREAAAQGANFQPVQTVLNAIVQTDPGKALSLLESLPDTQMNAQTRQMVLQNAAFREPETALNWVLADPSRVDRSSMIAIGRTLARHDVNLAIAALPRIDEGSREIWHVAIVGQLVQNGDLDAATQFTNRLRGTASYAQTQSTLVQHLAQTNPDRAFMMLDGMSAGPARDAATSTLANMSAGSPEKALSLASSIEDQNMREHTMRNVLTQWSSHDPSGAEAWVSRMPSPDDRDTAYQALSHSHWADADRAMQLTNRIQDESRRVSAQWSIIHQQARRNPDTLERLLEQSSLSEEQKRHLRERVERRNSFEFIQNPALYR